MDLICKRGAVAYLKSEATSLPKLKYLANRPVKNGVVHVGNSFAYNPLLLWIKEVRKDKCQVFMFSYDSVFKTEDNGQLILHTRERDFVFHGLLFVPTEFLEIAYPAVPDEQLLNNDSRLLVSKFFFLKEALKQNKIYRIVDFDRMPNPVITDLSSKGMVTLSSLTIPPTSDYYQEMVCYLSSLLPFRLVLATTEELLTCENEKVRKFAKTVLVNQDHFYLTRQASIKLFNDAYRILKEELRLARHSINRIKSLKNLLPAKMKRDGKTRASLYQKMTELEQEHQLYDRIKDLEIATKELAEQFLLELNTVEDLDEKERDSK